MLWSSIEGRLSLLTREWHHSWKHVQVSDSLRNSFTLIVSLWSRHPFLICKHSPPLHLSKSFATSVLRQHTSFYSPLLLTMFFFYIYYPGQLLAPSSELGEHIRVRRTQLFLLTAFAHDIVVTTGIEPSSTSPVHLCRLWKIEISELG